MGPDKGWRTRPAVQVFVAATDRKISACAGQVHRHRARAVRQVPDRQDACGVCGGGHGFHVVHGTGAVVDVRQHQHRHFRCQGGGNVFGFDQQQAQAARLAQPFGDVEVGRKVAALADQQLALGAVGGGDVEGSAQHFVEVDRGAVGGHDFAGLRANQRRNLVAQPLRQVEPAGAVPGTDQALAPFARHRFGDPGGGGFGQRAE